MLGIVAIIIILAIVVVLILVAMRLSTFRIERSINIKASPKKYFR